LTSAYGTEKFQQNPDTIYIALPAESFLLTVIWISRRCELRCPEILLKSPIGFRLFCCQAHADHDIQIGATDVFPDLLRYTDEIAGSHAADQE